MISEQQYKEALSIVNQYRKQLSLTTDNSDIDNKFSDKIDEWHNGDSKLELYEYLGLSKLEYKIWVSNPDLVEKYYITK